MQNWVLSGSHPVDVRSCFYPRCVRLRAVCRRIAATYIYVIVSIAWRSVLCVEDTKAQGARASEGGCARARKVFQRLKCLCPRNTTQAVQT
jgi:hypothetical protein